MALTIILNVPQRHLQVVRATVAWFFCKGNTFLKFKKYYILISSSSYCAERTVVCYSTPSQILLSRDDGFLVLTFQTRGFSVA